MNQNVAYPGQSQHRGLRFTAAELLVIAVVVCCFFQNIVALLAFNVEPSMTIPVLAAKDVLLFLGIAYFGLKAVLKRRLARSQLLGLLLLGGMGALWLLQGANNLVEFRLLITPNVLLCFGLLIAPYVRPQKVARSVLWLLALVIVLGIIERFFLYSPTEEFWDWLNLSDFMIQRDATITHLTGPLGRTPASFYTSDFIALSGFEGSRPRRFITLNYFDALVFAHALAFACVYLLIRRRWALYAGSLAILVMTLGKGGLLVTYLASGIAFAKTTSSGFLRRVVMVLSIVSVIAWILSAYFVINSTAMVKHVDGIASGITSLATHPLGQGVGEGGNRALREAISEMGRESAEEMNLGAESFIGSALVQVGLLALATFSALIYIAFRLMKSRRPEYLACGTVLIGTLFASLLSESAISYTGSGFVFILAGIMFVNESLSADPVTESTS